VIANAGKVKDGTRQKFMSMYRLAMIITVKRGLLSVAQFLSTMATITSTPEIQMPNTGF
jgi:hypothetical protein